MAITVGDAVLKITGDTSDIEKKFDELEEGIKKNVKEMQRELDAAMATTKKMGIAIAAVATAVVAGLVMATKAAAEEEAGIERLRVAMNNVGLDYDKSRESLESWISAQQTSTAFSDSEQRDALASLIRMTGDLSKAQDLLTLAMDMSIGTGKDLATANQMVMYALGGNWGQVEQYIPALKQAQSEEEKWMMLRELFAGQAESYGATLDGQMKLMKDNINDITQAIGGALSPVMEDLLTNKLNPILEKIAKWIEMNPELVKAIAGGAGLIVALAGLLGMMVMISKAITAVNAALVIMHSLSGVGILKMAAGLAVAGAGIVGINKLMSDATVPSFQGYEGIIPGVPGTPILAKVHAGEYIGQGKGTTLNISVGNFMGDEMSMRQFTRKIKDVLDQEGRRSFNKPTETTYYSEAGHL